MATIDTVWRECNECGFAGEYCLFLDGVETSQDIEYYEDPPPGPCPCPVCESLDFTQFASIATGVRMGGEAGVGRDFPYFDRGLGMRISNHEQREAEIKKRGLIPLEGQDVDFEGFEAARYKRLDAPRKRQQALEQQYQEDPEYKVAYGKLMERALIKRKERIANATESQSRAGGGYKPSQSVQDAIAANAAAGK